MLWHVLEVAWTTHLSQLAMEDTSLMLSKLWCKMQLSVFLELSNAVKYSCTIVGTADSDLDQILVCHVVQKVDMVPAVCDKLVVVVAKTEVAEPFSHC